MKITPTVEYPTIVEGVVEGQFLRLESLDGSERFINRPYVEYREDGALSILQGVFHDGTKWKLSHAGPFIFEGKTWGVSHLQKKSRYGWLKVSPDCYHRWYFWAGQEEGVPGTERGIYFRKPFSWRWDVAGTNGQHWIWTRGYLGMRWD